MWKRHDPATVFAPLANYSNGVEVEAPARWLFISGQVGVDPEGQVEEGFEAQCRRCFANIAALLAAADMDFSKVVKLGVFLTRATDLAVYRKVRDELVPVRTASSLLIVAGLARPDFLVEIEAVAAAAL